MATRHECEHFGHDAAGVRHVKGVGIPRRKRCACGDRLLTEEGVWCVFPFDPSNRYAHGDRHQPERHDGNFQSHARAARVADRLTDAGGHPRGYVVRFVPTSQMES